MSRFYDRRVWRDRVQPLQLAREPLCRMCKAAGRIQPATQVDHVMPIDEGGDPVDEANLQSLCDEHHGMKTRQEHGATNVRWGCDANGLPLDPKHPWRGRGAKSSGPIG